MPDRSLRVLLPVLKDQKWSCHSCGDCCRTLVGHITIAERDRIWEQEWEAKLGLPPVVRAGRSWMLNKRSDGACVFLDENNRCKIHAQCGEAAKPLACRIFPFSVRPTAAGWRASLRFDCPSVTGNVGASLATHRVWLDQLVGELPAELPASSPILIKGGIQAQAAEIRALEISIQEWLLRTDFSMVERLVGTARVVQLLSQANLRKVRDDRFADLVEILFETVRGEASAVAGEPTLRQLGMLRQAAMAHAEHVSLAELSSGLAGRLAKRWQQLGAARCMLSGEGMAPALPGIGGPASFSQIDQVTPAANDAARIDDLLRRYLVARIEGESVFGAGYYGWSVIDGYSALLLSVAVAGWLSRYIATVRGGQTIEFSDAAAALGIVDRAATRLPALGTWAERSRIAYLLMNEGLSRLLFHYRLT